LEKLLLLDHGIFKWIWQLLRRKVLNHFLRLQNVVYNFIFIDHLEKIVISHGVAFFFTIIRDLIFLLFLRGLNFTLRLTVWVGAVKANQMNKVFIPSSV
jgi:hypothetical protein